MREYTAALAFETLGPDDRAVLLCNRAQVHLRTKTYAAAVEDCTACLTLSPLMVKAMFRRGVALEALGNKTDALKDFREVLRADPSIHDAQAAVARCVRGCSRASVVWLVPSSPPHAHPV